METKISEILHKCLTKTAYTDYVASYKIKNITKGGTYNTVGTSNYNRLYVDTAEQVTISIKNTNKYRVILKSNCKTVRINCLGSADLVVGAADEVHLDRLEIHKPKGKLTISKVSGNIVINSEFVTVKYLGDDNSENHCFIDCDYLDIYRLCINEKDTYTFNIRCGINYIYDVDRKYKERSEDKKHIKFMLKDLRMLNDTYADLFSAFGEGMNDLIFIQNKEDDAKAKDLINMTLALDKDYGELIEDKIDKEIEKISSKNSKQTKYNIGHSKNKISNLGLSSLNRHHNKHTNNLEIVAFYLFKKHSFETLNEVDVINKFKADGLLVTEDYNDETNIVIIHNSNGISAWYKEIDASGNCAYSLIGYTSTNKLDSSYTELKFGINKNNDKFDLFSHLGIIKKYYSVISMFRYNTIAKNSFVFNELNNQTYAYSSVVTNNGIFTYKYDNQNYYIYTDEVDYSE